MKLSGWGRHPVIDAVERAPRSVAAALADIEALAEGSNLTPRGLGRSYGDSALGPNVLSTRHLDQLLSFDEQSGVLRCAAGVSLATILEVFVPRGWFPPVTPGTKFVTVGGAIASDVHGKNHHHSGSFSEHVLEMQVVTAAEGLVTCSKDQNVDLFRATAGGMGLTGLIVEACIQLQPVRSANVNETTLKAGSLQEALDLFQAHEESDYSVAWIDCLTTGKSMGRSLLSLGEHARDDTFSTAARLKLGVPVDMPGALLNRYSIRAFNTLYYHRVRQAQATRTTHYDAFFYPLDSIADWNRMYGANGFVQYQFVLPVESGEQGLKKILERIVHSGRGSFLAVLKVFGEGNSNLLSFPTAGYTLALDFKVDRTVLKLLDELDRIVLDHAGRIYLTKDARMAADTFRHCYPAWEEFSAVRKRYGADKVFHSHQSRRLEI